MKRLFSILFLILLLSCSVSKMIVDKPIIFNEERIELTLQYLNDRYGLGQETPTLVPRMIVLHWTAIPTMEGSFDAFLNTKLPKNGSKH